MNEHNSGNPSSGQQYPISKVKNTVHQGSEVGSGSMTNQVRDFMEDYKQFKKNE
jgi:hypothetical protein